jgi:hypothetical protein
MAVQDDETARPVGDDIADRHRLSMTIIMTSDTSPGEASASAWELLGAAWEPRPAEAGRESIWHDQADRDAGPAELSLAFRRHAPPPTTRKARSKVMTRHSRRTAVPVRARAHP